MVVKDEAAMLPRFLECARGLYDELLVVDTGSTDDTVALLAAAGARVFHEPWRDDFAAARNVGLEQATGEWILILDPDEQVSPELTAQARALTADARVGAATVRMVNALPNGHERVAPLLRLFRNDPSVRFRFPIHEEVASSVTAMLETRGLRMGNLTGRIQHLGYVREHAAQKHKKERDDRLLARCLKTDPDDAYSHFKRMELARFWQDPAAWTRAAEAAHAMLERTGTGPLATAHFGGELVVLVADGLFPRAPAEALRYLQRWTGSLAPSSSATLRMGELSEQLGDVKMARTAFKKCLTLRHLLGDLQLARVRPRLGLMRLALARGALSEALKHADAALLDGPRDLEALLGRVMLARNLGGDSAVASFAAGHRARVGPCSELEQALGEEALFNQDAARAVTFLTRASPAEPRGELGLKLAQARLAAGDVEATRLLVKSLQAELPHAALGLLLCDLAQGRDSELEVELDEDSASAALRDWLDVLKRASPAWPAWRNAAMMLTNVFPWLPAHLGVA